MIRNIIVTRQHIQTTIELFRDRKRWEADNSSCEPGKSYCSSCPVANAIDEIFAADKSLIYVDVDGMAASLGFGDRETKTTTVWWNAALPDSVCDWIGEFDDWLQGNTLPEEVQELLDRPETWPAPPAVFELDFEVIEDLRTLFDN